MLIRVAFESTRPMGSGDGVEKGGNGMACLRLCRRRSPHIPQRPHFHKPTKEYHQSSSWCLSLCEAYSSDRMC